MKRFMRELLNEKIVYGGLIATRLEAYEDAYQLCASRVGFGPRAELAAEMFAFGPNTRMATAEDVQTRRTLAQIRST